MPFSLHLTDAAKAALGELRRDGGLAKRLKAVQRALAKLETDPRHPGLNSHPFRSLTGPNGEEAFESYAEQDTPPAYRVIWCYGPIRGQIVVIAITRHP